MKWFKAIPAFCATLLVAVSLAGCAGSPTKESTGGYIDDTVVTTKVKTALFNEKDIKSSEISVQTFKGRVQLSGFVSSAKDASRAVEVTRRVQGVRLVENDLKSNKSRCESYKGAPKAPLLPEALAATTCAFCDKVTFSYPVCENTMYERYAGLIFDMDGTILDTEPTHRKAWHEVPADTECVSTSRRWSRSMVLRHGV